MISHPNLTAYDGVEATSNFQSPLDEEAYCSAQIDKSIEQVNFIKSLTGRQVRVIEYCSGNSRLLYGLYIANMLTSGIGIEISKSRHTFAESWKRRLGIDTIQNIRGDVLGVYVISPCADVALCVTGAFQYFSPIQNDADKILLRSIRKSLIPGGTVILEIYPHANLISACQLSGGKFKMWDEMPERDPWQYYLSEYEWDNKSMMLTHHKIFIPRKSMKDIDTGRTEVLKIYRPSEISDLFEVCGFDMVAFYGGWNREKADESSLVNVIVGVAV